MPEQNWSLLQTSARWKWMQSHIPGEKKNDSICQLALLSVQVIGRERNTFADIYQLVYSFFLSRHEVPQWLVYQLLWRVLKAFIYNVKVCLNVQCSKILEAAPDHLMFWKHHLCLHAASISSIIRFALRVLFASHFGHSEWSWCCNKEIMFLRILLYLL